MNWKPTKQDLKQYRHFDAVIPIKDIIPYVSCPSNVSHHKFMPFIHFTKQWRRAPIKRPGQKPIKRKPKKRNIRYAARKDAYIFKYYREMLSSYYEDQLLKFGLSECVLAYRTIPKTTGGGNKSNIEFAKDAFDAVDNIGKCTTLAIDISDYFGSMSHHKIKSTWCTLLNAETLPADHFAVFRALTKFRFVDRDEAYAALGYSEKIADGSYRYKLPPRDIPHQICTNVQFRDRIVGSNIVRKNEGEDRECGVPQGAPLSDLIANAYLLDFDLAMKDYATSKSGRYFRYSDDILFIIPGDGRTARAAYEFAAKKIAESGEHLKIKPEKTEITCYRSNADKIRCYALAFDDQTGKLIKSAINQGLSYLGFRYDLRKIYLRSSTISNLRGKVFRSSKAIATNHVDRHMDKNLTWLLKHSPLEELTQKFFQVEDFEEAVARAQGTGGSPFSKMTFFSYAERASKALGDRGSPVMKQTLKVKTHLQNMLNTHIKEKYKTKAFRLAYKTE